MEGHCAEMRNMKKARRMKEAVQWWDPKTRYGRGGRSGAQVCVAKQVVHPRPCRRRFKHAVRQQSAVMQRCC